LAKKREEIWFKKVADRMVREDLAFRQAAGEEGVALTTDECAAIHRSRSFQNVLWQSRFEYYTELGSNPTRTKTAALGLMTLAIQGLVSEGQWDKALEGILKLAKVEGWVGGDANLNVFANLTQADIDSAKKHLQETLGKLPTVTTSETLPN